MITAQYHGVCSTCGETIAPGQRIESVDDQWQHVDCHARPERVECVCEKCWTVHVGVCI